MILPPAQAIAAYTAWVISVVAFTSIVVYVLVARFERGRRRDLTPAGKRHRRNSHQRMMEDAYADALNGPPISVTEVRTVPAHPPQVRRDVRVRLDPDQQPTVPMTMQPAVRYVPPLPVRYNLGTAAEAIVGGIAARHGVAVPAYRPRTQDELAEVLAAHVEITGGACMPSLYPQRIAVLRGAAALRHVNINQHLSAAQGDCRAVVRR